MSIAVASHVSSVLPLTLTFRKRPNSKVIHLVRILTAFSFLFDTIALYYGRQGVNTYSINNLFLLVEFLILILIYKEAFKWRAILVYWTCAAYTVLFAMNFFFIQPKDSLNSYAYSVSGVVLIMLSLLYFRYLLKNLPETFVHRIPMIWVNIAVLVYFSGNLFLFMLYNYFLSAEWILHNMLNITKNLLLFIAVWQSQRKTISFSS